MSTLYISSQLLSIVSVYPLFLLHIYTPTYAYIYTQTYIRMHIHIHTHCILYPNNIYVVYQAFIANCT